MEKYGKDTTWRDGNAERILSARYLQKYLASYSASLFVYLSDFRPLTSVFVCLASSFAFFLFTRCVLTTRFAAATAWHNAIVDRPTTGAPLLDTVDNNGCGSRGSVYVRLENGSVCHLFR